MFYLIEVAFYALLGAVVGLINGEAGGIFLGVLAGVFVWAAYWFLNRVWLGGGFVQKAAILFVGGFIGTLRVLLVGDLIRMLLYQFYKGDQIVDFALFGTKTKWEPVVDLPPEGRVNGTIKHKLSFHKTNVLQLNFIQNGQVLVSSTADGETSLWNVTDGQQIVAAQTPYALSSDGTILAYLGEEGRIEITKIGDSEPTVTLQLPNQKISQLGFTTNGDRIAAGTESGLIGIWMLPKGLLLHELEVPENIAVSGIAFSPDGSLLAIGVMQGWIHLFDANSGNLLRTMPEKKRWTDTNLSFSDLTFSPDGQVLKASQKLSNIISFWHVSDGKKLSVLDSIDNIKFYSGINGSYIAVGIRNHPQEGRRLRIWEPGEKPRIRSLQSGEAPGTLNFTLSPDQKLLATSSFAKVKLWDLKTGRRLKEQRVASKESVFGLAISPTGDMIATGSENGSIQLLRFPEMVLAGSLERMQSIIFCLTFSPDGKLLASGAADGSIHLYSISK